MENSLRGIAWMLVTMLLFSCVTATAKVLTETLPVTEILWARYFFQMLLLLILLRRRVFKVAITGKLKLQIGRSLLLLAMTALFFTALTTIPMADATAVMLITPVLITALTLPVLGERVGPRRWFGVVVGFTGALIIIRPGLGVAQLAILLPVAAAGFHALYQLSTRFLNRTDGTMTTLLYSASTGAVIASLVVPFFWVTPTPVELGLMVLMGLAATLGHFCMIKAFEAASPAVVAPFYYTNLIWATLFGYILFADLPDRWTVTGALIIAASGLYILGRERARGRPALNREQTP